jgi:hypothetical protein
MPEAEDLELVECGFVPERRAMYWLLRLRR